MTGRVTVLGATGGVGHAAVEFLQHSGVPLRLVGRRPAPVHELADRYGAEMATADIADPDALGRACADSAVVLNCAGPASLVGARAASAAAGCDYVDAAGDDRLERQLADAGLPHPGRVAVLGAGMSPGLTGLLPRLLAAAPFTRVEHLLGYSGGRDRFTPAAAADYLASLTDGYGTTGAVWQDGRPVFAALAPRLDEPVPFFPGRVSAFPYLSGELQRLAAELRLTEARWFNVFDGEHLLSQLANLQATASAPDEQAARRLCTAAELDTAGLTPYQTIVVEITGHAAGQPLTRSLVAHGQDAYRLSGAMAAATVLAVLRGELRPGRHRADAVLPPQPTVRQLSAWHALSIEICDQPVAAIAAVEEGAL